ncbi:MAG: ATP-binding protein [Bacteroidales bacterium]|nr:ATP-binding protein [Bacteroidales bacterium]
MEDFLSKETYTIKDIQDLIDNEVEESVHLEFKSAGALGKWDSKKAEMTKDVAAFANSDGGIIIYGLSECNHKASSLSFVDGTVFTKEWLEQVLNSGIQQKINGIKIYPIRNKSLIEQSVYVVKIPKSFNTPHMSKDRKFYRRYNFEAVPMEEYEVRELYNRKSQSKLLIQGYYIGRFAEMADSQVFHFLSQIENVGALPANSYKMNIYINCPDLDRMKITWEPSENFSYTMIAPNKIKLSATSTIPIYKDECLDMARFSFEIPNNLFEKISDEISIDMILLYSDGKDEYHISNEKVKTRLVSFN